MQKRTHELKIGDIVAEHGGTFEVLENARSSLGHRPMADHLTEAQGPSDCAVAKAKCISGNCGGYFYPGSEWVFQGNFKAPKHNVIN